MTKEGRRERQVAGCWLVESTRSSLISRCSQNPVRRLPSFVTYVSVAPATARTDAGVGTSCHQLYDVLGGITCTITLGGESFVLEVDINRTPTRTDPKFRDQRLSCCSNIKHFYMVESVLTCHK